MKIFTYKWYNRKGKYSLKLMQKIAVFRQFFVLWFTWHHMKKVLKVGVCKSRIIVVLQKINFGGFFFTAYVVPNIVFKLEASFLLQFSYFSEVCFPKILQWMHFYTFAKKYLFGRPLKVVCPFELRGFFKTDKNRNHISLLCS